LLGEPDELVILGVRPNPEPNGFRFMFHGKCPVVQADPHGPITADPFEVKGRVTPVLHK
jgi:hypothetical protein